MHRTCRLSILTWTILAACAGMLRGADRLFEREPYDVVVLNAQNDNKRLDVETLERPLPQNPRPSQKFKVRLRENPDAEYEVEWRHIDRIELFEERVLAEAVKVVEAGNFEEAYDYFVFLRREYPETPGLDKGLEEYLYREAIAFYREEKHAAALARLLETYRQNPERNGLDKAISMAAGPLIEEYLRKEDYGSIRRLLETMSECYPQLDVVRKYESSLTARAGEFLTKAKDAMDAKEYHEADAAVREVVRVWPALPGAIELRKEIARLYPRIVVGVTSPMPAAPSRFAYWNNWSYRRTRRLIDRTLMEYRGPGAEGGVYACPFGDFTTADLGRRLTFELERDIRWSEGHQTLTGADVARRLYELGDPKNFFHDPVWHELGPRISVEDVFRVHVDLARRHVCPGGLLRISIPDYRDAIRPPDQPAPTLGPFRLLSDSESGNHAAFQANARYFGAVAGQPREIVEKTYSGAKAAIGALRSGEVVLLDRVCPWDVPKLREFGGWTVGTYKVPLVHCLVPNYNKPLTGHRGFRRALVYAINREAILAYLLGGSEDPGNLVVSGPFPRGSTRGDPIGYAYDPNIEPRGFDPTLSIALIEVSIGEILKQAKKQEMEVDTSADLTLAHPADEVARAACEKIQENLKWVGLNVTLQEAPPGETPVLDENVDLLYVELAMWEPVVDVDPLLGLDGLNGGVTPYMSLALKQLRDSSDWRRVGTRMRQVHRIVYNDVAVVPLWQLYEYFVHTPALSGVGESPVVLYENVERWRLDIREATEGEGK